MGEHKEKECCSNDGGQCGCGSGCCGGKVGVAIVILLVGGLLGYVLGRTGMCAKMMKKCPMAGHAVTAPAVPGK